MSNNSGGGGSWGPEEKQVKDKYAQIRDVLSKYGFNPNDAFKPSTSGTGTVGAVYNPNTGGAIGTSGSLPGQFNQNANIRLGDYSQDAQGNWKVVTNSPTDLANKFVTSNAAPLQGLSFGDYAKAAGRAMTSSFGVPSGDNVAEMAGTGIAGGLLGNAATPAPLKAIWAIGNFADSLIDAQDAKIDAYLNQDFNYDLALDFYKDDKGDIRFKPNYKKMAEGGSESGKAVLAAQNINMTDVSMSDDNKMNINVSPVFAASDRYKEALKFIKNTYGTLTKEQANEVVDSDTGKTRLQTIEDYLKSEQSNYLYNVQTIKDIKEKAPNASEKSLNIAVDTSKIGYLNEDQLSKVKVSVYNKDNQLEEINAKVYLDSIKNMSKVERNDYMLSLGNRMNDPSISDDEKAVLYAQSRALYAASDLDGGYKGMYQRDFLDEIGSMPEAFTGMTWNTIFDGTDLETFRQDEFSSGLYSLASTGASIVTLSKATNLIESGIRKVPGLSKLSKAVGNTSRQAVASTLSAAEKTGESAALTLAKIAGKTAGQLGFQVAADALYDAAKIIPYALKDDMDEYDFLRELGNDFVMDMLITYGPRSFAGSMNANATKTEYRVAYENTKTGDIQYFRPKDVKPDSNYKMLEGQDGTRDSKLVDVTSEELATRHAKAIDSLTDSNAALKVQELIFDKNAAMSKLAVQVRSVSDRYHYHKMLRYAADARQITEDTLATFLGKNNVSQHWEAMRNTFKEVAPKVKDLSKADQNYIKAVVNEARFLGKNAGDKKAETVIKNFYKSAKSGVDASRAEELNTLIKAMQDVAADVLDFYVEKGLMKAKDVKELRSQPGYENGYLPMYMSTDVKSSTGGDVGQDRALYKKVKDAKALIAIDDLDNPLNSLARYINNAMRAVAMNDRALAIREAASMAGVGIHLVEDSGGAMKDIVNLKEFDAGFKKIYKDIAIKTKKSLPSQKEWQETNDKMVLRSNALKAAQKVQELQDEIVSLQKENRQLGKQAKKLSSVPGVINMSPKQEVIDQDYDRFLSDNVKGDKYSFAPGTQNAITRLQSGSGTNEYLIKGMPEYVREHGPDAAKQAAADVRELDRSFKQEASKDMVLYRGSDGVAYDWGKDGTATIKTFVETSYDPELAFDMTYKNGLPADETIVYEIKIPKGQKIIAMPSDIPQGEIVLPSGMKWEQTGQRRDVYTNGKRSGVVITIQPVGSKVDIKTDAEKSEEAFGKLNTNRTLVEDYKQQQLAYVDDIKRYTGNLMERAQKAHKGSDVKLDIKLYLDVQVTNSLKQSLKSDNMVGQVQGVLNNAVQAANPWVDPQVVIERRAHAAAVRYRNKIAKDLKEEAKKNKKEGINSDRINAAVDRAMDKVLEKITGERKAEVTFIDDEGNATTKMLDNYEDSHTIRYMLNGKEQRMVLDGQGSEELVAEFYAPEFTTPKTALGKVMNKITRKGNEVAQIKRYLTTSADISRVIPNIMRDWSRGIVSTGGQIVLSPEKYFAELSEQYGYTPEQVKIINNGLMLAREAIDKSTLTSSLQMPNKNRDKSMVRAMTAPDGNGFVRYMYDLKTGGAGKVFSALQDLGETFTRKRAMDIAYYQELARAQGEGKNLDVAVKRAVEAAYFSGRESTVNFRRRGVLIGKIAQSVPYLTQRFATLQSFTYSYLNDPVGVANALKTTVSAYTALVAIALSNEESRKKYFMLNEYDRANNIIIPIDNGLIITLPLDDTIAAFLTPYRRMVESMNGLDPQAFYLCFAEGLAALSPADLSGFSEGDGFNVARGFEKLGAEFIPTWAQPFVEAYTGKDLYYGSALSVNNDYTGSVYGTWNPTPGQMTTQSRNSKTLATISDNTGIPQWILQNFLSEYGGNIGQYVLNTVDKIGGATEAQQGGKEWMDSVFKPFTGLDSDSASNAFYDLVNGLKEEKTKVQNEIKTLTQRANNAGGEEKAELLNQRQKKIEQYGLHVTDAIENYLSAFEITGGLNKKQANQVWYLYKLYDEDSNDKLYVDNTTGDYYTDKAKAWNNKQATSLAAGSGIDSVVRQPVSDYYDSYAEQAFKQTSYGDTYHYIAEIEDIMNDNNINRSEMFKNYDKMTSAQKKQWKAAWNTKVVKALAPYIQKTGIDNVLDQRKIVDYLDEVIFVSNPWDTKQYLKKIFGGK